VLVDHLLGLFDAISRADRAYGVLKGRPGTTTTFDVTLIGLDGTPVEYPRPRQLPA
jgi:hypothetical protein